MNEREVKKEMSKFKSDAERRAAFANMDADKVVKTKRYQIEEKTQEPEEKSEQETEEEKSEPEQESE